MLGAAGCAWWGQRLRRVWLLVFAQYVAPGGLVGDVSVPNRIFSGVDALSDFRTRVLDQA
jgi:hypothetical protein